MSDEDLFSLLDEPFPAVTAPVAKRAGIKTDEGGRPVMDEGGRPVLESGNEEA